MAGQLDSGTVSLCLAALLLLSGLWAERPLDKLAEQSAVLGAVLLLSLFRSPPLRSHPVQPRLPPVRALVEGTWTLVAANSLEPEDSIEVQSGDVLPTACEVVSSKGNFQVAPSLCPYGIVKSGSAVLKVLKPIEDKEVAETWRLPGRFRATTSVIFKLAVAFEALQGLQSAWKSHSLAVHTAAEAATMLWLAWETAQEAHYQLLRCFHIVKSPPTVSFWRRWQAGALCSLSAIHLSTQDEFLYTCPTVTTVLRPGPEVCRTYSPCREVEGFDRWWSLLATHCAVSSRADLVSWRGGLVAYGDGTDTAMRLLAERIGVYDPGFHRVKEALCPEQYSEQIRRNGSVEAHNSDQMGQWTLRKTSEGYQTLLCGGRTALSVCSQYFHEGQFRPLEGPIRAQFEGFEGIVLCLKLHSEDSIQTTDLALLAGLMIESQPKADLQSTLKALPDIPFVASTASEAQTNQLLHTFPTASRAPASQLVLLPESQAAQYLASLPSEAISTSLAGGLTLAGQHSSVSRQIQADIVLQGESLAGLVDLIGECRRAEGLGTLKALFALKCVVAVLGFGLGGQVWGRNGHLDLPWTALALGFCALVPANIANKHISAGSATLTRNTALQTCLLGAAFAVLALFIESQCFLQPEWLLDTRSPDFLQASQTFSLKVQATGLKSLHFSLLVHLCCLSPTPQTFLAASAAFIACAISVSWKSGLSFLSLAELWTLGGAASLHLVSCLVLRLYRPRP